MEIESGRVLRNFGGSGRVGAGRAGFSDQGIPVVKPAPDGYIYSGICPVVSTNLSRRCSV